jgi:hypothetical protein
MKYENRLLTFLSQNPKLRLTPAQIASIWKRSKLDVQLATSRLLKKGTITQLKNGALRLS